MSSLRVWVRGVRSSFPIALGYLPVALAFGIVSREAGLTPAGALLMSATVFAGASQFALVGLLSQGAVASVVLLTTIALNLRHIMYGPLLAPSLRRCAVGRLPVVAFGLTDEVFATALAQLDRQPASTRSLGLLGLEMGAYAAWTGGTLAGALGGEALVGAFPAVSSALSMALPALFLVLLLPMLEGEVVVAALAAAVVAVVARLADHTALGLLAAGIVGPLAAILTGGARGERR